ncbi:MAG TPA: hypothetical protein VKV32_16285 [Stellaceae bacterium]|nr:hypothetical protein [Stellaceae bacterium]
MSSEYLDALKLTRERRYEQAAPVLVEVCRAAPAAFEPWTLLALCLLCLGRFADLQAVIGSRHRQAGDGLKCFNTCLSLALEASEYAAIRNVVTAIPKDSALTIVAQYMAGVVDALDGNVDGGIEKIQNAATMIAALPPDLAADPSIETIINEACLLAPSAVVAELERSDFRGLVAALGGVAETLSLSGKMPGAPREKYVFLSSCDQHYLERFGETIVRALDATGADTIYHLHVVDPSPEVAATIAHLQSCCSSLTLNYSTEVDGRADRGYARAEFYACSRLVRLPEIFALYDRDVFMWDMDTSRVTDLAALVGAMKGFDLGYFEMKNTRLTLVAHLAAVYFANTPAARRLGKVLGNYILTKFVSAPLWLLDQASVYCSARFLGAVDSDFHIRDFAATGRDFLSYVDVASSAEEKQAMRKSAAPIEARSPAA